MLECELLRACLSLAWVRDVMLDEFYTEQQDVTPGFQQEGRVQKVSCRKSCVEQREAGD